MREIRDPDHLNATRPLSKDDFWENQLMFCAKKNLYFTAFNLADRFYPSDSSEVSLVFFESLNR